MVMAIFLGSVSYVLINGQKSTVEGSDRTHASYLAGEAIERVRSIRDASGTAALTQGTWAVEINPATKTWALSSTIAADAEGYTTNVFIDRTIASDRVRVTATTKWHHGVDRAEQVQVMTEFTDWEQATSFGNWASPAVIPNALSLTGPLQDVVVSGNNAYVTSGGGPGLYVLNITTTPPTLVASPALPGGLVGGAMALGSNNKLYVVGNAAATGKSTILQCDISNPSAGVSCSTYYDFSGNGVHAISIVVQENGVGADTVIIGSTYRINYIAAVSPLQPLAFEGSIMSSAPTRWDLMSLLVPQAEAQFSMPSTSSSSLSMALPYSSTSSMSLMSLASAFSSPSSTSSSSSSPSSSSSSSSNSSSPASSSVASSSSSSAISSCAQAGFFCLTDADCCSGVICDLSLQPHRCELVDGTPPPDPYEVWFVRNGALVSGTQMFGDVNDMVLSDNNVLIASGDTVNGQYAVLNFDDDSAPRFQSPQAGWPLPGTAKSITTFGNSVFVGLVQGGSYDELWEIDTSGGLVPPDSSFLRSRDIAGVVNTINNVVGCYPAIGTDKANQQLQLIDAGTSTLTVHGTLNAGAPLISMQYDPLHDNILAVTSTNVVVIHSGGGSDACTL